MLRDQQSHTHGPDDLPECICRRCHPELNMTADQRHKLDAEERKRLAAERARLELKRQIAKTEARLAALTKNGEPAEGTVPANIAKSLRKKLKRLHKEAA